MESKKLKSALFLIFNKNSERNGYKIYMEQKFEKCDAILIILSLPPHLWIFNV